jgi:hypothetical protein
VKLVKAVHIQIPKMKLKRHLRGINCYQIFSKDPKNERRYILRGKIS